MASGTLGADELARERHRWSENSKVYSRKFHKTKSNNSNVVVDDIESKNPESSTTTTTNPTAAAVLKGNNDKDDSLKENDDDVVVAAADNSCVANGVTDNDNKNNNSCRSSSSGNVNVDDKINKEDEENEDEDGQEKLLSSTPPERVAVVEEEANSSQPQLNSSRLETVAGDGQEKLLSSTPPQRVAGVEEEANSSQPQLNSSRLETVSGDGQEKLLYSTLPQRVAAAEEEANSSQPQLNSSRLETVSGDGQEKLLSSTPPQTVAAVEEEANSSQPQLNSSRLETVSGDSLSLNRAEGGPLPNGHDGNLAMANGSVLRSLVTQVEDRLNISVSAARSKEEVKDLKRKLEDELGQVRKMARKLEAKEVQLSGYTSIGGVETTAPGAGHLQFPVNGGIDTRLGGDGGSLRMNSEMGSLGFNDTRPFRQLSVSVMNNNHHGIVGEVVEKEKRTPKANQYYRNSEFLLGKDKLPPAESNRKTKSAGGKKHGGGEFDYGSRIDKKIFSKCSSLLQKIMNHKHGWVFNQPVDVKRLGLHDYFDIIKHPMDLGTVKARLAKNWYKTPREFAEDVRLTFHNALTYNPPGQDVHIMATDLLRMFEEKWPALESEYDRKLRYEMIRDLGVPTPTSRKTYAPAHVSVPMSLAPPLLLHPPPSFQEVRNLERSQSMPVRPEARPKPSYSVGRKPAPKKPKAKDPHKRDMTFEEKQKLSTNLQSLPSEKLDAIVQIIKKRNSALSQHDDEIEVDIDSVDAETLWELDRFVTNYKKSLSKHKRKAELAQARAAAAQAAQDTIPAPAHVEAPRETAADEGNVPPPPRAQQEKQNDNASGSSSSSSSSSGSGSSSSDSDSDSSSGSDSDGGH